MALSNVWKTGMYTLQRSKSHGFGAIHLKDIIVQTEIKNIMLMITQNVF